MEKTTSIKRSLLYTGVILAVFVGCNVLFTGPTVSQTLGGNIAIKGYDTVAYFKEGRAIKGDKSFSFKWHGANWYFSNKKNLDVFIASPGKYAPQYGGYCAWAMSEGRKAHTDPEVWKIVDGKLYLNCSQAAFEKWQADIPGNIRKADANWQKLADKD